MIKLEIKKIVYIEDLPAFSILPNGEIDWIAPDTATIYTNNKEFVEEWLKINKLPSISEYFDTNQF